MGLSSALNLGPVAPPALLPGARIGVAALSGVVSPLPLEAGMAALQEAGYEPVGAPNLLREHGLFAGNDSERLEGLHALARDSSIDAILFARGGHGVLRLLPLLDWELLAVRPRWYVGYSDLTPFLTQVVHRLGWLALHGPMVASEPGLAAEELQSLRRALTGDWPLQVPLAGTDGDWRGVEGRLAGGCLTMLASTLGTEWAAPTAGSVLFLEDVHEPLYRVDRMLQQLRLAGALEAVRGIVLGPFETERGESHSVEDLLAVVRDAAPGLPVAWGCPSGHCRPNVTLALGALARIDPVSGHLVLDSGPALVR